MSGIFTRPQYDECYSKEYKKMNDPAYNYSIFLDYNVNPNMKANMNICLYNNEKNNENKHVKCHTCDLNKEATLDKTPENFKKITEIDNNLKGINYHLTYCNDKKFQGCFNNTEENNITVNPYLCNREITPTNMKKFDNVL
jgi:hypothetical protein